MSEDRKRKFKCPACQAEVPTEIPEHLFINKPTISMLILVHQEPTICPGCNQPYSFFINGIKGMEMGWMPVTVEQRDPGIITVPSLSLADIAKFKKGDGN